MAYDQSGATVGAAGHDAATLTAALIGQEGLVGEQVLTTFFSLRDAILANSLEVQAATALASGVSATPAPRNYSGGSGKPSGGPAGGATEIRSGKYTGRTVGDIVTEDRDYAEWAAGNMKNEFLKKAFTEALAA